MGGIGTLMFWNTDSVDKNKWCYWDNLQEL